MVTELLSCKFGFIRPTQIHAAVCSQEQAYCMSKWDVQVIRLDPKQPNGRQSTAQ